MKMSVFGSKVIGEERAKEQATFRAERRHKFGPLVLGDKPALAGTSTPDPTARQLDAGLKMSIDRLKETLKANPYLVTTLFEKELYRPRGARVEALAAMRDAIPKDWVQGGSLKAKIEAMLLKATADSGVVFTEEAQAEAKRTAAALEKKGFVQGPDGEWVKPTPLAEEDIEED